MADAKISSDAHLCVDCKMPGIHPNGLRCNPCYSVIRRWVSGELDEDAIREFRDLGKGA
jgi:hypothetical protein